MPVDSFKQESLMSKRKAGTMYFADRKFVPRIKEFLEGNQKGFDVENVVDHLRVSYPEYGRRKKHALRLSVLKVLNNISTKGLVENDKALKLEERYLSKRQRRIGSGENHETVSDNDSDSVIEGEELVEYKDSNLTNNFMQDLYKRTLKTSSSTTGEKMSFDDEMNYIPWKSDVSSNVLTSDTCSSLQLQSSKKSFVPVNSSTEEDLVKSSSKKETVYSDLPVNRIPLNPISEDEKSNVSRPGTPLSKKSARRKSEVSKQKKFESSISKVTFQDIGGCNSCLQEVCKLLLHLKHPEIFTQLGVKPPRGFLLHGAPGCGKTLLANAIAGELQIPFFKISAPEIVSGISGESEQKIRMLFNQAMSVAPSIIFIDEIDSITPKRESAGKEMERRVVTQILTCMDDLASADSHVLVIGATNRVDALDPALRRAGRFDREIAMGIPDITSRKKILEVICRSMRLSGNFNYDLIAALTPGFVGADIEALAREAALCAINRAFESLEEKSANISGSNNSPNVESNRQDSLVKDGNGTEWLREQPPLSEEELSKLFIKTEHFQMAVPHVQPSAKREGFATVPDVTWDDIGALENVRDELSMAIMAPVQNPAEFASLGLTTPPGILLAGPPGCGKTLLAKAIANEAGINFISVKGPELLNMYVGESEKAVRQVFQRARTSSPCVIFFDEIDALCPRRSLMGDSTASSRVVNQLLTEMDGLETRKQVFIMAATNRPDILDNAILRPGRLDKLLYVGLPNADDRVKILKTITKNGTKPVLGNDVIIESLAANEKCEFFSGADLTALVREASITALKEYMKQKNEIKSISPSSVVVVVCSSHFEIAFEKVKPSVSDKDRGWYSKMEERYGKLK